MTTYVKTTCAYCGFARTIPMLLSNSEEHMWCIKCFRTSKFDVGTKTASKIEDIKLKEAK